MTSPRRKLPIGIQTFREIREDGCYYVDKTPLIGRLIDEGKYYFLSRPRRFGKSLLIDTIAELFAGDEMLFRGLFIHDRWDWSRRAPVVRLNFTEGVVENRADLDAKIDEQLEENEQRLGVHEPRHSRSGRFSGLIRAAHAATGERVVVLVDEYDKPILDNLLQPEVAREIRAGLRDLYSVIKAQDAHICFALITGDLTPTSPRWGWTSGWRTPAVRGDSTWRCAFRARCGCSSSRWSNWNRRGERWRRSRRAAMPISTAPNNTAGRSI